MIQDPLTLLLYQTLEGLQIWQGIYWQKGFYHFRLISLIYWQDSVNEFYHYISENASTKSIIFICQKSKYVVYLQNFHRNLLIYLLNCSKKFQDFSIRKRLTFPNKIFLFLFFVDLLSSAINLLCCLKEMISGSGYFPNPSTQLFL